MSNTVSVVIPAFNASAYIVDALDSINRQTLRPEQVIVVDDGSEDDTISVVDAWRKDAPDLDVHIERSAHAGLPTTRNTGFELATTDCVALLDADDMYLPHHLAETMRAFEFWDGVVCAFADVEYFDDSGVTSASFLAGKDVAELSIDDERDSLRLIHDNPFVSLIYGNYISASSVIFRREPALDAGLYDPTMLMIEDRDFNLRMTRTGRFAYNRHVTSRIRRHAGNMTHPRHMLRMVTYEYKVVQKMHQNPMDATFSASESAAIEKALFDIKRALLHEASKQGRDAYAAAQQIVDDHPTLPVFETLKNQIRAMISVGRGVP